MTMTAQAAKREGQTRSLWPLTDEAKATFLRIVAALPEGFHFSLNAIREECDAAQIRDASRAGLMTGACAAGLCTPLEVDYGGRRVKVTEPSTGASAHGAHVQVYVRTALARPYQQPTECVVCDGEVPPGRPGKWCSRACFVADNGPED